MKTLCSILLLCLLATGCATPRSTPPTASSAHVLVANRTGTAAISRADGVFKSATRGSAVHQGDVARTGNDGRIDFDLRQYGGVLTLHPDSLVRFEQIGVASDPQVILVLDLSRGRVTGDTLKLPGDTKIVVKTPNGVHEIR
jgi:hypothetical protein